MKRLFITSAIVAYAGVASAEVTWGGDAVFGYRSHGASGLDAPKSTYREMTDTRGSGVYVDGGLKATGSAELDDGVTAEATYGLGFGWASEARDVGEDVYATSASFDDYPTIKLKSSVANLTVGDEDHAAHALYGGPNQMDTGFTEQDGELISRLDMSLGGATVGFDHTILGHDGDADNGIGDNDAAMYSGSTTVGAKYAISGVDLSAAFETGEYDATLEDKVQTVMGASAGYTWRGIGVTLGYATKTKELASGEDTADSVGIGLGYTMANGLKLGAAYALNSETPNGGDKISGASYEVSAGFAAMGADIALKYESDAEKVADGQTAGDPTTSIGADLSYKLDALGLTLYGGYDTGEDNLLTNEVDDDGAAALGAGYAGVGYDLGGGASLFASYAEFEDAGPNDYYPGGSVGLKLSF